MNALNEVNKLIANVTYNLHKHGQGELDEWLTAEKVAVRIWFRFVVIWFVCFYVFATLIGVGGIMCCPLSLLSVGDSVCHVGRGVLSLVSLCAAGFA